MLIRQLLLAGLKQRLLGFKVGQQVALQFLVFCLQLFQDFLAIGQMGHLILGALELHLQFGGFDALLRALAQVFGQAKPGQETDQPLGGVVMPPVDTIAVIVFKDMVEVMVTLTISKQCSTPLSRAVLRSV